METQAPNLQLDLICETLGVSLETLAERARVAPEDLYMARDGRWHPMTLIRLSEHLGVSPDFFEIPTEYLTELLKAFSVVEPSHRLTLVNKIWNIETVLRIVLKDCILPPSKSLRFSDMKEAFEKQFTVGGHWNFVAFVRQWLDHAHTLVFSHPFGNSDYTAILFAPNKRSSAFKYLVVNENERLSPLTNALFQWYEVLRLLLRLDNTNSEDGVSLDPAASWSAIYLEPTVDGYCPCLNEQLCEILVFYHHLSQTLSPNQLRLHSIRDAFRYGLPPAALAERISRVAKIDGEESVAEIVRSLNQPIVIDEIVNQIVRQRMVPIDYDWAIPSYPSFAEHVALYEAIRHRIPPHVMLKVLPTSKQEYDALLRKVEQLSGRVSPRRGKRAGQSAQMRTVPNRQRAKKRNDEPV